MTATAFELRVVGGPWQKRLAPRRAWIDALPWDEPWKPASEGPGDLVTARILWTRTAFAEYAAAAAFGEIVRRFLAANAPIDLVAAAGDFVIDEIVHAEAAARIANTLGGAVPLEVDLERLVRPASHLDPLVAAAEIAVRACCIGETLTVPILKTSRNLSNSPLVTQALNAIVVDEAHHAQLGWWFLDWADGYLDRPAREHLARVAEHAIASFAPILCGSSCESGLGVLACADFDPVFLDAVTRHVVKPLSNRDIFVRPDALLPVAVGDPPGR